MTKRINILVLLLIVGITSTQLHSQPSKSEITSYIRSLYSSQLNVTGFPESFYDCSYQVFLHNYRGILPQKEIGDVCLNKLLDNKMIGVTYSDGGRKLYQVMKAAFINTCAMNSPNASSGCSCYYNELDNKDLTITEVINIESNQPELHKRVFNRCFGYEQKTNTPTKASNDFKSQLAQYFRENLNVVSLPQGFLECADENKNIETDLVFDKGYLIGKKCFPQYIDEVQFSDKGRKYLKVFNEPFVLSCTKVNAEYSSLIKVAPFCNCLHEQYVKYELGMEEILDDNFFESILSQKIAEYCILMNSR